MAGASNYKSRLLDKFSKLIDGEKNKSSKQLAFAFQLAKGYIRDVSIYDEASYNKHREELLKINPNAHIYDELKEAFVGFSLNGLAIYDTSASIKVLMRQNNCSESEAKEMLEHSFMQTHFNKDENQPIFANII